MTSPKSVWALKVENKQNEFTVVEQNTHPVEQKDYTGELHFSEMLVRGHTSLA